MRKNIYDIEKHKWVYLFILFEHRTLGQIERILLTFEVFIVDSTSYEQTKGLTAWSPVHLLWLSLGCPDKEAEPKVSGPLY